MLLFTVRQPNPSRGESTSQRLDKLCAFADQSGLFRRGTVPATVVSGLWAAPRWHHARPTHCEKPAGLEHLTLTFYQDHIEHRVIARIMQQILASHQVTMEIKEISYDQWHKGEIESDIWLNSANFTLPLDFRCSRTCAKYPCCNTVFRSTGKPTQPAGAMAR